MRIELERACAIASLALPIAAALLLQTVMSLVGIAIVSHLGDAALAGVGLASALLTALFALLFGIDTGVQVLVAHNVGGGRASGAGTVLTDALLLAAIGGPALALFGYAAGPWFLSWISADRTVVAHAVAWLYAALPALPFLAAGIAFSACRNGTGAPHHSLLATLMQLAANAGFGFGMTFGAFGLPPLGTAGAGLAASLASLLALVAHVILARLAPIPGFMTLRPTWFGVRRIVAIGLPVGLQQSLVYVGILVQLAIVSLLGTGAVAAMNVVQTMLLLSILPAAGVGIAAATLVGQALGRGDAADATRWGWEAAGIGALPILALGLGLVLAPRTVLGSFVADAGTIALAAPPLAVLALGMGIDAFGRILGFALRGAGATRAITLAAFALQWGGQLPTSWLVGVHLGFGLVGIAINRLAWFAVEAAIATGLWHSGFWKRSRIVALPTV